MKMKQFQRLLAFVLVICMVIPMLPEFTLPAAATDTSTTEDPVIVIAGSDFQNTNGDETDVSLVNGLFSSIKTNGGYTTVDGFLFAGDYSYQFTDAESRAGMANLKAAVQTAYPSITDIVMVQGNHDQDAAVTDGTLSPSGANDTDDYGVFVIHEKDYMWYNNDGTTIQNTATALDTYLDAKIAADYDKPIFVVSHLPLHYNMRTANDGDGMYANYLFDVLNAAGTKGLNIIFLFGHNHSNGWDDYLGGSAVYLAKGDSINIAQASRTEFNVETLNFTYMNAGYVAYYNKENTGAETDLTMTVFEITSDKVTIARYSADGLHDLKSVGVTNSYKSETDYDPDTRVYASTQSVLLNKVLRDDATGVVVAGTGLKTLTVSKGAASQVPAGYTAYQTYDMLVDGHTYGAAVNVSIPVDDTFDASKPVLVIDHERNKTMVCDVVDGCVNFKTTHFSMYTVAQANVAPVSSSTWYNVEEYGKRVTSTLETGVPYVITYCIDTDSSVDDDTCGPGGTLTNIVQDSEHNSNASGLKVLEETSFDHLWYVTSDGYLVYGSSDSDQYLLIDYKKNTDGSDTKYGDVKLGAYDANTVAYPRWSGTWQEFEIRGKYGSYIYLNLYGGNFPTNSVATTYSSAGGTYWDFNRVISTAWLTVTPSQNTVTTDGTILLVPTVTAEDIETADYKIAWTSEDETIATVDANGVVTPKKPGQVYIKATLTAVDGHEITKDTSVEIMLTVVEVTKDENSVTATTLIDRIGELTTLTAGQASGPFVIRSQNDMMVLTGNKDVTCDPIWNGTTATGLGLQTENHYDHVWYYDGENLRYDNPTDSIDYLTATDNYLVYEDGKVTLGEYNADTVFNTVKKYSADAYTISGTGASIGGYYINQYGGSGFTATSLYSSDVHSQWYLYDVILDTNISLTVSPNEYILSHNKSVSLAPTVKVDDTAASSSSITWTSSDTSLATVDENGQVTSLSSNGGNVTITATLTAVNGITLTAPLAVEIPIQIPAVTTDTAAGNITASIILGERMEQVTTLQQGVPYVITNKASGKVMTGNMATSTYDNSSQGLELITYNDFSHVWYYNGTNLLYGDSNGSANYLTIGEDKTVALGTNGNACNSVTQNTDGVSYTITNTNLTIANKYLNQHGGNAHNIVCGYSADGNSSSGSAWYFNQVMSNEKVELKIDYDPKQSLDQIQKIDATVWLDGVLKTGDYEIVWSSSNTSVATVSHGIVTPKKTGDVVITAKLVSVAGVDLADSFTVEIPIEITTINSVQISGKTGVTYVGTSSAASINQYLMVTYADGSTGRVPVKINMLTDANGNAVSTETAGVLENLTVTYAGIEVCTDFTLEILEKNVDDYPDYPDEGAVSVNKTGSGIDFQSSGIAQIELSATGVPSKKGADVIIMLDTSSSMTSKIGGSDQSRLQVLTASLNNLVNQLQDDGSGDATDIRVAIADFNGYYDDDNLAATSPYYIDPNDTTVNNSIRTNNESDDIYTGTNDLTAGAFVDVHDLGVDPFYTDGYTGTSMKKYTLTYSSGTNYDYAFDAIYQLGEAIQTENEKENLDRDLFVIFMSDGAPFQYNYFSSQSNWSGSVYWNNWLLGTFDEATMYGTNANKTYYNEDGLHWMAEAIKGDPNTDYPVIRKNDSRDTDKDNWISVKGLGATMYSIGFCLADDYKIKLETMDTVIQNIASNSNYYYRANTASELEDAFSLITNEIFYAATDAYFVDTMGTYFDIQLGTSNYDVVVGTETETRTITPVIQFKSYSIYTTQDFMNGLCEENQIGTRKTDSNGNYIYTLLEEVTFNAAGTEAYSNVLGSGNILTDGVIRANTFYYNTSSTAVVITEGTKSITIPAESFYWKLGTISTTELCLSYYVYLTGSMQGQRPAGIYDTNTYAELFYTNYLGNACSKEVPTPKLPWEQATVGYGFYLVDENGNPIVNQTTGQTGSFQNAVKITQPIYDDFLWNDGLQSLVASTLVSGVLPEGYELFDSGAKYEVLLNSNGTGYYIIYTGSDGKQTTYVAGVTTNAVTGGSTSGEKTETLDYTTANTVVWFGVVANVGCVPDTVVIDFGLPVDIHPLINDIMMTTGNTTLVGIGSGNTTSDRTNTLANGFVAIDTLLTVPYGSAKITNDGKDNSYDAAVRYMVGTMAMNGESVFSYAVHYTGSVGTQGFYYSTITVIPATSIYYEDNFGSVTYKTYEYISDSEYSKKSDNYRGTTKTEVANQWTTVGDSIDKTQAEDRPGSFNLSYIDANNIYGFDGAYKNLTTHSLGSAMKFTTKSVANSGTKDNLVNANNKTLTNVDMNGTYTKTYGTAEFTFYGTGFDVISVTSNTTGLIVLQVIDEEGNVVVSDMVDTYYGYTSEFHKLTYTYTDSKWVVMDEEISWADMGTSGSEPADPKEGDTYTVYETRWVVDPTADDALYQVPVIKIDGLTHGEYKAVITVSYNDAFDHYAVDGSQYDFYLDAIRIYDPANDGANSTVIKDAYLADGECWPDYFELRNMVIDVDTFDQLTTDTIDGIVFIDNTADDTTDKTDYVPSVSEYTNFGPNNELYLAPGQAVTFNLEVSGDVAAIHLALKTVGGGSAYAKIHNVANTSVPYSELTTSTDLYHDITALNGKTVLISNSNDSTAIVSITNIKVTYKSAHTDTDGLVPEKPVQTSGIFKVSRASVEQALIALINAEQEIENEPEVNEPETPVIPEQGEQNPQTSDVFGVEVMMFVMFATILSLAVLLICYRKEVR